MKQIIAGLCILMLISACSEKKQERAIQPETAVAQTAAADTEHENAKEEKISDIEKSLTKDFFYTFPDLQIDKNTRIENYSIESLSPAQQTFYHKYVGSYFKAERMTYDYLSRHTYAMVLREIVNGIKFYKLGKVKDGVSFNTKDNSFYEYEAFSAIPIKNIDTYTFHTGYIKVDEEDMFQTTIERKIAEYNASAHESVDEQALREFLIRYFNYLNNENYQAIIDSCIDGEKVKSIEFDKTLEDFSVQTYTNQLSRHKNIFNYDDNGIFDVYVNVYFSEDPSFIKENFGNCIFVEFKFPNSYNYFAFIVKEYNGKLKIAGYRYEMDEQ